MIKSFSAFFQIHKSSTSSPSSSIRCQNQNKPYLKLDCSKSSSTMPEHTSYIRGSVRTHMGTSTADNNCNAVQFNPKHPHLVEMVSANTADVSSTSSSSCEEDENTDSAAKHPKSRIGFLDMHLTSSQSRDEENDDMCEHDEKLSPCYSPNNNRKTMVPPLDLSILHEHMDSTGELLLLLFIKYILHFYYFKQCLIFWFLVFAFVFEYFKTNH